MGEKLVFKIMLKISNKLPERLFDHQTYLKLDWNQFQELVCWFGQLYFCNWHIYCDCNMYPNIADILQMMVMMAHILSTTFVQAKHLIGIFHLFCWNFKMQTKKMWIIKTSTEARLWCLVDFFIADTFIFGLVV